MTMARIDKQLETVTAESADEVIDEQKKSSDSRPSKRRRRNKTRRKKKRSRRSSLASFPLAGGKYRGRPVGAVPVSHLRWMLKTRTASEADLWVIHQFLDGQRRASK